MRIQELNKTIHKLDRAIEDIDNLSNIGNLEEMLKNMRLTVGGRLRLSVCMIVKNEYGNVMRAINSMDDFADEFIVLDTGSTDGTVRLLLENEFVSEDKDTLGMRNPNKKLYEWDWEDDFAKARNIAQSKCTGDYILWMDADDEIPLESAQLISASLKNPGQLTARKSIMLSLNLVNIVNGEPIGEKIEQPRIYPNRPDVVWEGRIHETFIPSIEKIGLKTVITPNIFVYHHGYDDPEVNKEKNERNFSYLKKEPENAMVLYHLGTTCICKGEVEEALIYYSQILETYKDLQREFHDHIRYMMGTCEYDLKNYEASYYHFKDNEKADAKFWMGELYRMRRDFNQAKKYYIEYLALKEINDPWGTKQKFYRYHSFVRLMQIQEFEQNLTRKTFKEEYPEEPAWK